MAVSGWCLVAKTEAEHRACRYPACTCTCHGGPTAPTTTTTKESTDS